MSCRKEFSSKLSSKTHILIPSLIKPLTQVWEFLISKTILKIESGVLHSCSACVMAYISSICTRRVDWGTIMPEQRQISMSERFQCTGVSLRDMGKEDTWVLRLPSVVQMTNHPSLQLASLLCCLLMRSELQVWFQHGQNTFLFPLPQSHRQHCSLLMSQRTSFIHE